MFYTLIVFDQSESAQGLIYIIKFVLRYTRDVFCWENQLTITGRLVRRVGAYRGRAVWKPFNVNPGLKFHQSTNFSCVKIFYSVYILSSLSLVKLETEGQTVKTEKLT